MNKREWLRRAWCLAAASVVLGSGCSKGEPQPDTRPPVLSERMGLRAPPATKLPLGADCTDFEASSGCASDLCLRRTPGFPPRGICSVRCGPVDPTPSLPDGGSTPADERPDATCPVVNGEQWICQQILPRRTGFICTPPAMALDALSADGGVQ